MDLLERNAWQRAHRLATANKSTFKYERETHSGFLMRAYHNMKARVNGVQKREAQYYQGLALLPKDEFVAWSLADTAFQALWAAWQAANRDRRLTPSVDRKDVTEGYVLSNMQWVTHAVNSGRLTRRDNTTRACGEAWHEARRKNAGR